MSTRNYTSLNPFTENTEAIFELMPDAELNIVLIQLKKEQGQWEKLSVQERTAFLPKLAELLKQNADVLAHLAAIEMGKLFTHAKAEVLKSASLCEYYHREATGLLGSTRTELDGQVYVEQHYKAMGIILGIFPWNFPYWQILRSAIPSIISGNAMLVKPAPNVPQSSLALQKIIDECGLPHSVFKTAFLSEAQVTHAIQRDEIAAVTLTGSEMAGASVASQAAKEIKPAVLELGGSDPLLILKDAPLAQIMDQVIFSRFQNNGQSCVAAKRFLVEEAIADTFKTMLVQKLSAFVLGNPMEEQTQIGPLARKDLRDKLAKQVTDSLAAGAQLLYQHRAVPDIGYFYPPTVLTNIPKNSPAYAEELFGPVLSLFTFKTDEEAIALANDTRFGLGASIFTEDLDRANKLAHQIESGMVYLNQMVKSDVRIPFGGSKHSGFGRELGPQGLYAFCQVKTIWKKK